jgi:hypothetical protein
MAPKPGAAARFGAWKGGLSTTLGNLAEAESKAKTSFGTGFCDFAATARLIFFVHV